MSQANKILDFWFGATTEPDYGKPRKVWFTKESQFDNELRSKFIKDYQRAAEGYLDDWKEAPESCLALILLLDQFPRNIFRGNYEAFATDWEALSAAQHAVKKSYDRKLLPVQRWFIYLPFEHSENLEHQRQSVELFKQLSEDPDSAICIEYAIRHLEIIERFGRFPQRNTVLGRISTSEEKLFLKQPGSHF